MVNRVPDLPWDFGKLSETLKPEINYELLEKFQDRDWDFNILSKHPNLSLEWIY